MLRQVSLSLSATCLCWLLSNSGTSFAQQTDPAAAERLFRQARELLTEGKIDEACPKFIESQRLEPATGTLLAVANCHEEQGQLASAWAEYNEVMASAEKEGRFDRAELARESAQALEPRLSTLLLSAAPELLQIPELSVRRGGIEVGSAGLNRALPIDGGKHEVELASPGYLPEKLSIEVQAEGDRAVLTLPLLRRVPVPIASPVVPAPVPTSSVPAPSVVMHEPGLTGTQSIGVGIGAAGLGAAVVGGAFFIAAMAKVEESGKYCSDDGACTSNVGVQLREDAVQWGNLATALAISGGVLAAAGVTLYWVGGRDTRGSGAVRTGSLHLVGAPDGAAARLELGF